MLQWQYRSCHGDLAARFSNTSALLSFHGRLQHGYVQGIDGDYNPGNSTQTMDKLVDQFPTQGGAQA